MEAAAQARILRLTEVEAFMSDLRFGMRYTMQHIYGDVFNYNTTHVSIPLDIFIFAWRAGPLGRPRADVESAP
jgi:hypothetical protein